MSSTNKFIPYQEEWLTKLFQSITSEEWNAAAKIHKVTSSQLRLMFGHMMFKVFN